MSDRVVPIERFFARRAQSGGETAPTPQRMARAADLGEEILPPIDEDSVAWRISPALDELLRRGTIEQGEYQAGQKFLKHYYLGQEVGPRTQSFKDRVQGGGADAASDWELRRVHYTREVQKAIRAVDPMFYHALAWMIATLGDSLPLSALGEHYAPGLGRQTQSARGGQVLATTCAMLCRHYGMQHRLTIQQRVDELNQFLALDRRK